MPVKGRATAELGMCFKQKHSVAYFSFSFNISSRVLWFFFFNSLEFKTFNLPKELCQ